MRIIAGRFKGRKLRSPNTVLRPTQDKVREAIYSTLFSWQKLEGARVLDLFAGTGAFGFEALSRGAAGVCFIESNPLAVKAIASNSQMLELDCLAVTILHEDVFSAVTSSLGCYDVIFADPPYGSGVGERLISLLLEKRPFERFSLFVFEDDGREDIPSRIEYSGGIATLVKQKRYSETVVRYFELKGS